MRYQFIIFLLFAFSCVCSAHTHAEFEGIELKGEKNNSSTN